MIPDRRNADQEPVLAPDAHERHEQGDVTEVQEVRRPVVPQIDRDEHRHERGVEELGGEWDARLSGVHIAAYHGFPQVNVAR